MTTTHRVPVPGASIHYEVRGSGPVLVIAGSPMAARFFSPLAGALAGDHTVITHDPRGISNSPLADPTAPGDPNERADDIVAILDAVGAEQADVFGSSGGAVSGLALVTRHPHRVRTLVAHEPPLLTILPDADEQMAMTDDIVGHAWVDVKEVGGQGRKRSVGFWPGSSGWLPTGGRGELMSPDGHDGQQMHRQKETMSRERFLRVLNVVNAWEGSYYQLLYRNCAHFAKAAWIAGTGSPDGIVPLGEGRIWTPAEVAEGIDYVNKKRGLDAKGDPLPQPTP